MGKNPRLVVGNGGKFWNGVRDFEEKTGAIIIGGGNSSRDLKFPRPDEPTDTGTAGK